MPLIDPALPFPVLETARLRLREPRRGDLPNLLRVHQDPEVMRYSGMLPFRVDAEALAHERLELIADLYNEGKGIRWVITLKEQDQYLGEIGYKYLEPVHARSEIGYKLDRAYWRKGLMSEALQAATSYGFETLKLNRMEALVDPRNTASLGLLQKCGYQIEGTLREYEMENSGCFADLTMLAALKRDWLKTQPAASQGLPPDGN